jgi:hypothetical protein
MHRRVLPAFILALLALTACASNKPRPAERAALRVDLDGTEELDAPIAVVHPAVVAALRALGHEVAHDDPQTGLLETTPKQEAVDRWRWTEATSPGTMNAASATASIVTGMLPMAEQGEGRTPPGDVTLLVSYEVTLIAVDEGHTRMILTPRATLDGNVVTDRYVADVLGASEARRKWDEIFDAVRALLAEPAGASPAPSPLTTDPSDVD